MKRENRNRIVQLRHELHMHPELSLQEKKTIERILEFLKKNTSSLEFDMRDGWFCAVKRGSDPERRIIRRFHGRLNIRVSLTNADTTGIVLHCADLRWNWIRQNAAEPYI